jgi:hypothetical protein
MVAMGMTSQFLTWPSSSQEYGQDRGARHDKSNLKRLPANRTKSRRASFVPQASNSADFEETMQTLGSLKLRHVWERSEGPVVHTCTATCRYLKVLSSLWLLYETGLIVQLRHFFESAQTSHNVEGFLR